MRVSTDDGLRARLGKCEHAFGAQDEVLVLVADGIGLGGRRACAILHDSKMPENACKRVMMLAEECNDVGLRQGLRHERRCRTALSTQPVVERPDVLA